MGPNKVVRDLSRGDCDVPKSDKCMCAESHIKHTGSNWALLTIARALIVT